MARRVKPSSPKGVEALRHPEAKRRNPTAEYQPVIQKEAERPLRVPTSGATATSIPSCGHLDDPDQPDQRVSGEGHEVVALTLLDRRNSSGATVCFMEMALVGGRSIELKAT